MKNPEGPATFVSDPAKSHATKAIAVLDAGLWTADTATGRVCSLQADPPSPLVRFNGEHPDWLHHIHPAARGLYQAWIGIAASDPAIGPVEYRMIGPAGDEHWVRHQLIGHSANKHPSELHGIVWVIDEQKRLRSDCLTASEREKANLGQELHDDICQILTGLHYLLGLIEKATVPAVPDLKETFIELRHQLDSGMGRTRALAHGLTPLRLVDENLSTALAALARQSRLRFGIKVDTAIGSVLPKHTPEHSLHVYRILQEAIANAVKHGRANHLKLRTSQRAGVITISLIDNGTGFSATCENTGGIGLAIMRNRAKEISGLLTIEPGRRGGTCVRLTYTSPNEPT